MLILILEAVGLVLIATGLVLWSVPVALVFAGAAVLGIAYAQSRAKVDTK